MKADLTPEQQANDITDEELAEWDRCLKVGLRASQAPVFARRLIAALRASRKREEEYLRVMQLHTEVVTRMDDELQTERAENERLRRITDAWGALEFSSRWAGPAGPA